MSFTPQDALRYSRHCVIPEVGQAGQRKLLESSVVVIGAGGLGSPLAFYLAAAGVGHICLIDFDTVSLSNLQRQILYTEGDVGLKKVDVAKRRLTALNSTLQIEARDLRLTQENALDQLKDFDVICDGSDNFFTRYLVNDTCYFIKKPLVSASIQRFEGQVSVFGFDNGPCYRCLFPAAPAQGMVANCAEAGVFGVLPGVLGCLQATETLKLLLGIGDPLAGRLLTFDALAMRFNEFALEPDPSCPLCGSTPRITRSTWALEQSKLEAEVDQNMNTNGTTTATATATCEVDRPLSADSLSVFAYRKMQQDSSPHVLLDVREPYEFLICNLQGVLVPLAELPLRLKELDSSAQYVVHCKAGPRSIKAAELLRAAGFAHVKVLEGGILAWIAHVDSKMQAY